MNTEKLKALLFDTVLDRLCDEMINEGTPDEIIEFFGQLANIVEQNGYEKQSVVPVCATGLRKIMAEVEANKDPNRKSSPSQISRMSLRFLTFYYMLAQIRPKDLEENEKWAYQAAQIPNKDRETIGHQQIDLFLLMLPDSEINKVFKGDELKHFKKWRKHVRG